MDKRTFLSDLEKQLASRGVADIAGIIEEYEDHFNFKAADGYTEDEIAARLGKPADIALQYNPPGAARPAGHGGTRAMAATGLTLLSILVFPALLLLYVWVLVLGVLAIACVALGASLITGIDLAAVIPSLPIAGGIIMEITSLALAVLAASGTIYSLKLSSQLTRSYIHWIRRCMAAASGRPVSPPIAVTPQLKPRLRRALRLMTGLSLAVLGIGFVLGYAVLALAAGSFEFWHVWGWFL